MTDLRIVENYYWASACDCIAFLAGRPTSAPLEDAEDGGKKCTECGTEAIRVRQKITSTTTDIEYVVNAH